MICVCVLFVFAFHHQCCCKEGGRNSETRLETVRDWVVEFVEVVFALFFFFQRVVQNNRHRKGRKIRGESISALGLLLIYLCVCVGVRSCLVCLTIVLLSRSQRDSRQFFLSSHTNRHSSRWFWCKIYSCFALFVCDFSLYLLILR